MNSIQQTMTLTEKIQNKTLKTSVLGAGAVGGYVGGMIAREHPVTLLCRDHQRDHFLENGLRIRGYQGDFHVAARLIEDGNAGGLAVTDNAKQAIEDCDLVFLCVKSQDTENLLNEIASVLSKEVPIVLLQNGVHNRDAVEKLLGPGRAIESVVLFNSLYVNPGEVTLTATESVIFDETESTNESAQAAAQLLEESGIATRFHKNVRGILWTKLIINLNNGSSALTGGTLFEGLRDPATRRISRALMGEGMEILKAAKIDMEPIPKVDPPKLMWLLKTPGWFASMVMNLLIKPYEDVQSSTWQSRVRGKSTEIDYLNGEIVRLATDHGKTAPFNEKIVDLVHELERNGDNRTTIPSDELARILGV